MTASEADHTPPSRLADALHAAGTHLDDPDQLVVDFASWADERGTPLYPHQEEAILEFYSGSNVVLATPTGSGKSMVALAAHASSILGGGRSWYTAPVKALVSEKFFDLIEHFGADQVGLLTGDSSVNPDAPIICCTTEVLALAALGSGRDLDAATVILDEFHYYGDPDRGWAWQTPLITLPQSQFVLMSATLGNTAPLREDLTARTGRPTALVDDAVRPVPLAYEYAKTPLHTTVEELLAADAAPLYLVNFSQRDALEVATSMSSVAKLDAEAKAVVAAELADARLPAGFGRDLARLLRNGVGVHHAGMLPRYRRLVERLSQQGVLRVISGTDTLGVGVNLPIRTVVLTRLYKYDGRDTAILSAREFHQIAGRAGRAGYDTVGRVVCLAPDHVAENEANEAKAAADPKKKKKLHKVPPPKGFVHYDQDTFERLQQARPEALTPTFQMTPGMLLQLLTKPGNTYNNVRRVLTNNHEPRARQRRLIRNTIRLYKGLRTAGVVVELDEPDELGRWVQVDGALQDDFALDQLLAPFLLHALPKVPDDPDSFAFVVLALTESIIDNPFAVLLAMRDKAKDEAMAQMKADGVEYDERIERLEKVNYPQPLRDDIYELFDEWRGRNPWIGDRNIAPKGVVRDMWDRAMDFPAFVRHYGLKRSEGVLLRYLSATYKALTRSVPMALVDDGLTAIIAWLGAVIRATDSSLVDEWEALRDEALSTDDPAARDAVAQLEPAEMTEAASAPLVSREAELAALVRARMFRWVQYLATDNLDAWADDLTETGNKGWSSRRLAEMAAPLGEALEATDSMIDIDADARRHDLFSIDRSVADSGDANAEEREEWTVGQRLVVDGEPSEWSLRATLDVAATAMADDLVLLLAGITQR